MTAGRASSYFIDRFDAFHAPKLHGLLDIPNKSAYPHFLVAVVQLFDGLEQIVYLIVLNHGNDRGVHFRPGVGASAGFPVAGTSTLYVFKEGESADAQLVQQIFNTFRIGLVKYNKYSFHGYTRIIVG